MPKIVAGYLETLFKEWFILFTNFGLECAERYRHSNVQESLQRHLVCPRSRRTTNNQEFSTLYTRKKCLKLLNREDFRLKSQCPTEFKRAPRRGWT
jgi:hypothetical protein